MLKCMMVVALCTATFACKKPAANTPTAAPKAPASALAKAPAPARDLKIEGEIALDPGIPEGTIEAADTLIVVLRTRTATEAGEVVMERRVKGPKFPYKFSFSGADTTTKKPLAGLYDVEARIAQDGKERFLGVNEATAGATGVSVQIVGAPMPPDPAPKKKGR